jgi:serine protease Do
VVVKTRAAKTAEAVIAPLRLLASASLLLFGCNEAPGQGTAVTPAPSADQSAVPPVGCEMGFAELAERADPAVVYIETMQAELKEGTGTLGLGSGFVIDPTGLILTNAHVIRDATRIFVVLNGHRLEAKVVGLDPPSDVAVVRVPGKDLPHLELGNSARVRVGDWVVAIGNPFGLAHTVSAGIVSAKGRTRNDVDLDPAGYYNFLQTDASINPGNSGGPLLDLSGRVVGVNTAIRAGANSIGFAIPIDMVKALLPRLVRDGKVQRSALGIVAVSLSADKVAALDLDPKNPGVEVQSVAPAGPADKAGVRTGDLVLEFDGEPLHSEEALRWHASIAGIGHTAELLLRRGPRTMTLRVVLGELEE